MITKLDDKPTRHHRALQVWQILTGRAANLQLVTFYEMAELLNVNPHQVHMFLYPVAAFCLREGLPNLSTLVIDLTRGEPGYGYPLGDEPLALARVRCFYYGWHNIAPPSVEQFRIAFEDHRRNS